jgi:hypothetical protein
MVRILFLHFEIGFKSLDSDQGVDWSWLKILAIQIATKINSTFFEGRIAFSIIYVFIH